MTAQPAGEESFDAAVAPLAVEALAGLRPDQSIEEAVRCARPDRVDIKENAATLESLRGPAGRFDGHARPVLVTTGLLLPTPSSGCAPRQASLAVWVRPRRLGQKCLSDPPRNPVLVDDPVSLDAKPISPRVRRRGKRAHTESLIQPALSTRGCQPRAKPCPAGPGAAIPVKRTNAVTLTAIAPTTAKMVCQIGEGIAICAIPCVAL